MAYAGPTPIIRGGTPTVAAETNLPSMGRPRRLATERRASRTAAAPSDTCEAFPRKQRESYVDAKVEDGINGNSPA